ncbi:PHO85 cyclin-5 [Basidiobolus ranarum]|uniref:PHO85 cyclin-5 n=1 Tax=Basidiobolus ranarum TaxID=34480 RepID=A0ABR2VKL2_9FUNG
MVTSFNTIFIPATPRACDPLQQKRITLTTPNFSDSRQFLINHFPNLSTVRMAEFAANVVSFLWSAPNSTLQTKGSIPMHSTSHLKDTFSNVLLLLELPTVAVTLALKYMHQLRVSLNASTVNPDHLTKLFVSCLLLAAKYHLDVNIRNSEWSGKVGIAVEELSGMERWILRQLGYNLGISYEDFLAWIEWLRDSWNQPTNASKIQAIHLEQLHMFNSQLTAQYLQRTAQYSDLSLLATPV